MANYYVNPNAQSNGDHEVHTTGCVWLDKMKDPVYLGVFTNCADAVKAAKVRYPQSNGCATCSVECHIS